MERGFWKGFFRWESGVSFGQWALDRAQNNWQWLLPLFGGGGLMGYLGAISERVNSFGPYGWTIGALLGVLVIFLIMLVYQRYQKWRIFNSAYRRRARQPDAINPLDPSFKDRRIRLTDLAPPAGWQIRGKRFVNCEIVGPANILMPPSNTITKMRAHNVDAILIGDGREPLNGYVLLDCDFHDCTFYNISFFVLKDDFSRFAYGMINVNWITDIPRDLLAIFLTPEEMRTWDEEQAAKTGEVRELPVLSDRQAEKQP